MSNKPNPVPPGFHTITPHLVVKGGAAAIDFYKRAFAAEEISRMPGPGGALMHAELKIGDSAIMLADEFPMPNATKAPTTLGGTGVVMHLYVPDCDAAFNRAVSAGAQVVMPPMNMFWGDRYCQISDPYGHRWSLATHVEDVKPEDMPKRMQEAMSKQNCG
jgi:uncharacterized glyoxalase superfamily protein PhnB